MFTYRQLTAGTDIVFEQQQRRSQGGIAARTEARLRGIFDVGNNVECGPHQLATFSREAHDDRPAIAVVPRPLEIPKLLQLQCHLADRLLGQQRTARNFRYGAAAKLQICKHRGMRDARIGEAAGAQRGYDTFVHSPGGARQQLAQVEAAARFEFGERVSHRHYAFAVGR
jgi:hypothetical protein